MGNFWAVLWSLGDPGYCIGHLHSVHVLWHTRQEAISLYFWSQIMLKIWWFLSNCSITKHCTLDNFWAILLIFSVPRVFQVLTLCIHPLVLQLGGHRSLLLIWSVTILKLWWFLNNKSSTYLNTYLPKSFDIFIWAWYLGKYVFNPINTRGGVTLLSIRFMVAIKQFQKLRCILGWV